MLEAISHLLNIAGRLGCVCAKFDGCRALLQQPFFRLLTVKFSLKELKLKITVVFPTSINMSNIKKLP